MNKGNALSACKTVSAAILAGALFTANAEAGETEAFHYDERSGSTAAYFAAIRQ